MKVLKALLLLFLIASVIVAILGGTRTLPLPKEQIEVLESFEKKDWNRQTLEKPDGFSDDYLKKVHVLIYGEGQPVLLIPGNFHSAHSYESTMRELGKYFQVWSYSPRGTGNSVGDIDQTLEEAYEELRLVTKHVTEVTGQKPIGLGHSFGGFMLRTLPEKDALFSGLVFLSPTPEYGYAGRVGELLWSTVLDWFDIFHSKGEEFSFVYATWVNGSNAHENEIMSHARTIRYQPQATMILQSANEECLSEKTNCPAGSELKTLFVAIEGDEAVLADAVASDFKRVHMKFKKSDFEVIEGGHSFFDDEELAKLLHEHFN